MILLKFLLIYFSTRFADVPTSLSELGVQSNLLKFLQVEFAIVPTNNFDNVPTNNFDNVPTNRIHEKNNNTD